MKKLIGLLTILVLIAGIAPTLFAEGQADEGTASNEPVVLKYGELNPDGHIMTVVAREFARLVEEKSDGSIIIDVYPGSQLGDERTETQALQMGAQDFFRANTVSMADFGADKTAIFALPYLFRNRDHLWSVLASGLGDDILADVQTSGSKMVGIGFLEEGARNFFFRDIEVRRLSDLEGQKIRVPQNQMLLDTVAALGGSPTPISYSELYSALQTGVVDGAENPPTGYFANNFYEVAPNYTLDGHTYSPSMIVMSEISWNKLNADQQAIIKEAAAEAAIFNKAKAQEADDMVFEELTAKGIKFIEVEDLEEWPKAIQSVYEKYGSDHLDLIDQIHAIK